MDMSDILTKELLNFLYFGVNWNIVSFSGHLVSDDGRIKKSISSGAIVVNGVGSEYDKYWTGLLKHGGFGLPMNIPFNDYSKNNPYFQHLPILAYIHYLL